MIIFIYFNNITLRNEIRYFDEISKKSEIEIKFRGEVSSFLKILSHFALTSGFRDISRYFVIFTKKV